MLELLLKQLGIKPDELKRQIADGGKLIAHAAESLDRIEKKIDILLMSIDHVTLPRTTLLSAPISETKQN